MASFQVEIASPSSFGCVLRDHSRSRDRCSSNVKSAFQKDFKELVHSCITSDNSHDSWLPENKVIRKPKILDRWARAREMVFPVDDNNNNRADNLILTTTHNSNFTREISPSQSDVSSSIEIQNSGVVSSLVRKWRHFADSKNSNAGNNGGVTCSSPVTTMSNSGSTFTENPSFLEASDSIDGKSVMSEELFFDFESDRTVPSRPPSSRGRDSDAAERERIRVADIVKKLTSVPVAGIEPLDRIRTSIDQQDQQRIVPQVIGSPRLIRGRQAYNNFLIQMEMDKNRELQGLVERKPVSKFSHRGRIQALLHIRFLRRESEAKSHRRAVSKTLDSNCLNIKHLRERFSTTNEHGQVAESCNKEAIKEKTPNVDNSSTSGSGSGSGSSLSTQARYTSEKIPDAKNPLPPKRQTKESQSACGSTSRPCRVEVENTTKGLNSCSSSTNCTLFKESTQCKDASMCSQQNTDQLQNNLETHNQEAGKVISEVIRGRSQEPADIITKENENGEEERVSNAQTQEQELALGSEHDWVKEISHTKTIWDGKDESCREFLENCQDWIREFSQIRSEWDEQESNNEPQYEENTDWINDIARPRSDWEDLRQERYQEMLVYSDNSDIHKLLERKSVSSFLSSRLRDRIDQLIINRTEGKVYPLDIMVKGKDQEQKQEDEQEGSVRVREIAEEEEEAMKIGGGENNIDDEQQTKDDVKEVRSGLRERQCNEYGDDFIDQTTSSMQFNSPSSQSWSGNGDRDEFDQFASPSLQQSFSSSSYSKNNQQSPSFMNHPSIEMEFIYDLRGYMEQLHQEISNLRKSIKSCVSMQVKLQRSIKQEVAAAVSRSVKKEGKESGNQKKHSCLVCRTMKVDSLLYRCGHMCMCLKCAQDLQWGSGKCPICQSPILDVVRTLDR